MSVWLCIPSKRPPEEANTVLQRWRDQGYKIALWCDSQADGQAKTCDIFMAPEEPYPGYAQSVNRLVKLVLNDVDTECQWVVTGGDDVLPDPTKTADEIAGECSEFFGRPHNEASRERKIEHWNPELGVMQCTGDSWGDATGPYIQRVAGSPWMGREFCLRINQGNGPLWPAYGHMGVDEELQAVAIKYGVFWQRPDLTHFHQHWGRPRPGEKMGLRERMPAFLEHANSAEEWRKYKAIFAERQATGFPGSEPLP